MDTVAQTFISASLAASAVIGADYLFRKTTQRPLPISNAVILSAWANTHTAAGSAAWMTPQEVATIADDKTQSTADTTTRIWTSGPAQKIWSTNAAAVASAGSAHATALTAYEKCVSSSVRPTNGRDSLVTAYRCSTEARNALLIYMENSV